MPFSYQSHFFKPVLLGSFVGHLVFWGTGSFLFSSPQVSASSASYSMEVVILKETEVRKEKAREARVLTSEDSLIQEIQTQKKPEPLQRPKGFQNPSFSPSERGAVSQARPAYFKNPAPVYPHLARERGWEGVVILKVLVRFDGKPAEISVEKSSGYNILDQAALKAVRNWQFLPARAGNLSFSSWVRVPVRFLLVDEV